MPKRLPPGPVAEELVRLMQMATSLQDGPSFAPLTHRLAIPHPLTGAPGTFTVDLMVDGDGSVLTTCRELPEVATIGQDEEEALALTTAAIEEALAARRSWLDLP